MLGQSRDRYRDTSLMNKRGLVFMLGLSSLERNGDLPSEILVN